MNVTCWLWLLLMGAGLGFLLGQLLRRPPKCPPDPFIDGLTDRFFAGLNADSCGAPTKNCATPFRLAQADAASLQRRLVAASKVRPDQYAEKDVPPLPELESWLDQAKLICDGKFKELREYQRTRRSGSEGRSAIEHRKEKWKERPDRWLALVVLVLLLINVVIFFHYSPCRISVIAPKECAVKKRISVPMDLLFQYNKSEISPYLQGRLEQALQRELKDYTSLTVKNIEAYADPIGGYCFNQRLARDRSQSIRKVLGSIPLGIDKTTVRIDQTANTQSNYPSEEDAPIWEGCNNEHNLAQPAEKRPLEVFESPTHCDNGKPPEEQPWPTVRLSKVDREASTSAGRRNAIDRAVHQREVIGCLAPMRRVDITVEGTLVE